MRLSNDGEQYGLVMHKLALSSSNNLSDTSPNRRFLLYVATVLYSLRTEVISQSYFFVTQIKIIKFFQDAGTTVDFPRIHAVNQLSGKGLKTVFLPVVGVLILTPFCDDLFFPASVGTTTDCPGGGRWPCMAGVILLASFAFPA